MSSKSDSFNIFVKFDAQVTYKKKTKINAQVECHFNCKLKSIQLDWAGEFHKLNNLFQQFGISHQLTCPHTHHQNGSVECKHRHILETDLTLLAHASVPHNHWDDAFLTAFYFINRLPSHVNNSKSAT